MSAMSTEVEDPIARSTSAAISASTAENTRRRIERFGELRLHEGFKQGVEFQKTAAPTPKARAYRDALVLLLAEVKHAVSCMADVDKQNALLERIHKAEAVLR